MNIVNPVTAIPSDLIGYFPSSCPSGWAEYTGARGRYIVGTPSGGDMADTVGSALTNKEDRSVGQHNHTFSGSALSTHTHSFSGSAHDHEFAGDALGTHTHTFNGSSMGSHNHTQSAHNHPFRGVNNNASASSFYSDSVLASSTGPSTVTGTGFRGSSNVTLASESISNTTPTNNAISAGTPAGSIVAITGGTPSGDIDNATAAGTNAAITAGTPSGTIGNAGSVASTAAPYIQLICCKKN